MKIEAPTLAVLRRGFAREFVSTLIALALIAAVKIGLISLIPW